MFEAPGKITSKQVGDNAETWGGSEHMVVKGIIS